MSAAPDWWQKPRRVVIVVDTPGWFDPYADKLVDRIAKQGDSARLIRNHHEFANADIVFYLSCTKIAPPEAVEKAKVSLVAHASDLPKGRGFSPVVWQILEGAHQIPISLIHAATPVDSGEIVLSDRIVLDGHELNDEIRARLGERIVELCLSYLSAQERPVGRLQRGEATWYERRRPENSRLDPGRSIAEQFDLLRAVDNERYPAFFELRGYRYVLRIEKVGPAENNVEGSK